MKPDGDGYLRWLVKHGPLLTVAAMMIGLGWAYGHVFAGEPNGDDNSFHLAEAARLAQCLRAGDYDFWNWSANAGYASAYYYQVLPQLVPAALTAISGGHLLFWFQLSMFLPLVLAPVATYRGARGLGADAWQAAVAAVTVSIAISSSRWGHGADGNFSVGLYTQTWAFAVFPLALGRGVQWLRDGTHLAAAVGWGALVGLCHPFAGIALGIALAAGAVMAVLPWGAYISVTRACARLSILGLLLLVATTPGWITVVVDYAGFGGFPKRVADEVGPGFGGLASWQLHGDLLDAGRPLPVLTWVLPIVLLFGRSKALRWLWPCVIAFAILLGIGKQLVTADDLIPAVRFLGPLQICMAMAIGIGAVSLVRSVWALASNHEQGVILQTSFAIVVGVLALITVVDGIATQHSRVKIAADFPGNRRDEMNEVIDRFKLLPEGRKQALAGAENHWWNLLPYVYAERPALLQMGGGGLQSSPNYIFALTSKDIRKNARVFFAPYLLFATSKASEMPEGWTVVKTPGFEVRKVNDAGLVSPVTITGTIRGNRKDSRVAALAWMESQAPLRDEVLQYTKVLTPDVRNPDVADARAIWSTILSSSGDQPDIIADTSTSAPSVFVARTSWHPRWHADVDGRPVEVLRVTPDFPAVRVGPGSHRITFRFDRPWWAHASWLLWPLLVVLTHLLQIKATTLYRSDE
jgi:hypothetical protein